MTEGERNAIEGRALLLYDGVCALCNGVVQFLIKRDKLDGFRFAPLQSSLGREVLARVREAIDATHRRSAPGRAPINFPGREPLTRRAQE